MLVTIYFAALIRHNFIAQALWNSVFQIMEKEGDMGLFSYIYILWGVSCRVSWMADQKVYFKIIVLAWYRVQRKG